MILIFYDTWWILQKKVGRYFCFICSVMQAVESKDFICWWGALRTLQKIHPCVRRTSNFRTTITLAGLKKVMLCHYDMIKAKVIGVIIEDWKVTKCHPLDRVWQARNKTQNKQKHSEEESCLFLRTINNNYRHHHQQT